MNMIASLTQSPRLLDQARGKIRLKHYSIRAEHAYVDWIKRFVLHFDKRHPSAFVGLASNLKAVTDPALFTAIR